MEENKSEIKVRNRPFYAVGVVLKTAIVPLNYISLNISYVQNFRL